MDYLTVFDWAGAYLDYSEGNFVVQTYKEKRAAFSMLFDFLSPDSILESVTPAVAFKCLMQQAKKRSGYAANKDRKNLAAGWEWGKKYLDGFPQRQLNPFRVVDKFSEIRSPRYVPSEEDFWKIYNYSEGQDQIMLLTFLHLAARRKEIFNLTWADVDFGNNKIRLWTSKRRDGTKEFDWLPMTSELRKGLIRWW